jgi:hypothetical protein
MKKNFQKVYIPGGELIIIIAACSYLKCCKRQSELFGIKIYNSPTLKKEKPREFPGASAVLFFPFAGIIQIR